MSQQIQDAYIVAATRSPIGRAHKGYFAHTRPDDLLASVMQAALAQAPSLDPAAVEDVIAGCAIPEAQQGLNVARIAAVLAGLGTPWNTLQPQGQLMLQTQGLEAVWSAGRMALAGRAQLDAMSMSSRLSTLRPMGSYRLELTGGEVPALALSTLQGPLQLTGSGQWVSQRLRFAGEASAAPDREAALANLLNIIGRRSGARSLITVG